MQHDTLRCFFYFSALSFETNSETFPGGSSCLQTLYIIIHALAPLLVVKNDKKFVQKGVSPQFTLQVPARYSWFYTYFVNTKAYA